jgi:hypothetical protein
VVFLGWFAALFTGRVPKFVRNLTTVYLRMSLRLSAYALLLTDKFPAFSFEVTPDDPTQVAIPEATRLNRWTVLFRIVMAFPVLVFSGWVSAGVQIIAVPMWFVVLITGKLPTSAHQAFGAAIRYQTRVTAYWFLVVPTYPAALFGDPPTDPRVESTPDGMPAARPWNLSVGPGAKFVLILAIILGVGYQITIDVIQAHKNTTTINQPGQLDITNTAPNPQLNSSLK